MAAAIALTVASPVMAAPVSDRMVAALDTQLFPIASVVAQPAWGRALASDPAFAGVLRTRAARIAACADPAPGCRIAAVRWTAGEVATLVGAVDRLRARSDLPRLPANADLPLTTALGQDMAALDGVLAVYGAGSPPHYPKIDGPVFAPGSANFADGVAVAFDRVAAASDAPDRLDGTLALAAALLDGNGRTEALGFPAIDRAENGPAAAAAARHIDWRRYRYTVLIVPGEGPEDAGAALSPRGKLRVQLAAQRFAEGLAPLILVSGAAVHPRDTRFVEAVEMRRALIDRFGVPADRIVLEPFARHTTTNLRNAVRRMVAIGVPLDRDALIVTDAEQSRYIESATFTARNAAELGYQPGAIGARVSPVDLPFRPSRASLRRDARDPRDP